MFQGCLRSWLEWPDGDEAQQACQPRRLPGQRWDIRQRDQQQTAGEGPRHPHVSTQEGIWALLLEYNEQRRELGECEQPGFKTLRVPSRLGGASQLSQNNV